MTLLDATIQLIQGVLSTSHGHQNGQANGINQVSTGIL